MPAWTFPQHDAAGTIVGISKRFPILVSINGGDPTTKQAMPGGKQGLYVPAGWREKPGPVFLPEGASDTIALTLCGLAAVGRPSNIGGVEPLAVLLRDFDPSRPIIVVGENDQKPDGKWPGREGAEQTAAALAEKLGRTVRVGMPPTGVKDSREWAIEMAAGAADALDWNYVGGIISDALIAAVEPTAEPKRCDTPSVEHPGELLVESLDGLKPKPVRYLVPNLIPCGMLGLAAGEGGHGKTMSMLALGAAVSTGRCAFGLDYPNPVLGMVLYVTCEDDWERTIIPRLVALGADLSRVLRIKGVKLKPDGETLDFHLGHFRELEKLLRTNQDIKLVVIDPAGAYIGRAGVNENKDAELRAILGPLSEAANATGAAMLLVKHLNKTAGASAVQRVSGSTGYVNAVRFAYMFLPDPEDPERKLMLPIKANVLPSGQKGLMYRLLPIPPEEAKAMLLARWPDLDLADLEALSEQLFRQQWEGEAGMDADCAVGRKGSSGKHDPNKVEKCALWLKEFLTPHAYPSSEILAAAKKAKFTFDNVKEAKTKLKDEAGLRHSNRGRLQGQWWSGFGDPLDWTLRPEPADASSPEFPHTPESPVTPHSPHTVNTSLNEEERLGTGETGERRECGETREYRDEEEIPI